MQIKDNHVNELLNWNYVLFVQLLYELTFLVSFRERSCKHHTTHDRYLCNGPAEATNGVTNVIKPLNVIKNDLK